MAYFSDKEIDVKKRELKAQAESSGHQMGSYVETEYIDKIYTSTCKKCGRKIIIKDNGDISGLALTESCSNLPSKESRLRKLKSLN